MKVRWIRLITCGTISAAPMPWATRNPISVPVSGASPQASENSVNRARPPSKTLP